MTDVIIYRVVTQPGGEDGRDFNDKGGTVVNASFEKQAMTLKYGHDSRYRIEPIVLDLDAAKREAMAKLTKVDQLVLFGSKARP
jgi:hypothetical protein